MHEQIDGPYHKQPYSNDLHNKDMFLHGGPLGRHIQSNLMEVNDGRIADTVDRG